MNTLLILLFLSPTDSVQTSSSDSVRVKPIVFKEKSTESITSFQYHHIQGFFCDFEDKINKGRKLNFNFGVGEQ